MEFVAIILICALVFGICYLVDKGFTKVFRNQSQHHSGKAIRLSKRYGSFGLILAVFGLAVLFVGLSGKWLLLVGGGIILVVGIGLVTYYMTFGVFYDQDAFVLTTFGKKSKTYRYDSIRGQQLFVTTGGGTVIEIYLDDGRAFQLQSSMDGVYPFMDTAFSAWLTQTGRTREDCPFYDPPNSCWFPPMGV